jgi:triosephosphate isomerase
MRRPIFAANWKMHLSPKAARAFMEAFLARVPPLDDREVWFFPPAIALEAVVTAARSRTDLAVGAQNVHWEEAGAFTGEVSASMIRDAGATAALVGHSERRHVFGETDAETGRKVRALLAHGLVPMLCVGEKIEQREAGATLSVVGRQLGALEDLEPQALARVVIAYEPVWAIGTGKTATPADAVEVHAFIRDWMGREGVEPHQTRILYGGSVKPDNVADLVAQAEIDGVLVGGASLDPATWSAMVQTPLD